MMSLTTLATLVGVLAITPQILDLAITETKGNKIKSASELKRLTGDGLILSKNVRISRHLSNEHLLVVYPSGGGKSRNVIMPNVKSLKNCSMIVTDPNGEILENCPRKDMDILVYNLYNVDKSNIGFDPLANCTDTFEVRQTMEILMMNGSLSTQDQNTKSDKSDWIERSLPLLNAYAIFNWNTTKYPFDIMIENLMTRPLLPIKEQEGVSIAEEIMESGIREAQVEFASFAQIADSPTTLACIRDTLNSTLRIFKETNIKKLCRKPTVNFKMLRKENCILYIQIPERYSKHYSPITATFVQQLFNKLLDTDEGNQIYFLFDEFCNIGKLNNITNYLSTCRKHYISITACIQNLVQLKKIYGEVEGQELQELFKTTLTCGGLRDSAEYFSKLLGDREVTENKVKVRKPLKTPAELRELKDNDLIILCKNKRPVLDQMYNVA